MECREFKSKLRIYEDGRSVLPTSVEFGSPARGRGGAADVGGGARQSARVAGGPVEVWSQLEVCLLL